MSAKNQRKLDSVWRGILVGILIAFVIPIELVTPVSAANTNNWAIGVWFKDYGGSGNTDWAAYVYNGGMPADSSGDQTLATFTATAHHYIGQISVENVNSGPVLVDSLIKITGQSVQAPSHSVSGLLSNWHLQELKLTTIQSCDHGFCTNDEYMKWILDGTTYDSYDIYSCVAPCSTYSFDLEMVPNITVESYDYTSNDFASLNVRAYFEFSIGAYYGDLMLYPAYWGAVSDSCSLPSGAQNTTAYVGRNVQGPSTAGVTGNYYDSNFGTTYESGILHNSLFKVISDSTLSSNCNPLPRMG